MIVTLADTDPVTRVFGLAVSYDPAQEPWLKDYFATEPDAPAAVRTLADGARDIDARVQLADYEGADAVIARRGTFDGAFFQAHPSVKFIQRLGRRPTGIDLAGAARAGVTVSCLPRRTFGKTSEHAILLMLAAGRSVRAAQQRMESGFLAGGAHPQDGVCFNWTGIDSIGLCGETVGIIGLGELGTELALRLRNFDVRVLYWQRNRLSAEEEKLFGVTWTSLDDLLGASRFVCPLIPYSAEVCDWMDHSKFSKMRPDAFFINMSRGKLVDEAALYRALTQGTIAGAALDVHSEEPAPWDSLRRLPNVFSTPHIAGGPKRLMIQDAGIVIQNLRAFVAGGRIAYAQEAPH
jgi:phosphoglycerate dehydrogenase-like enzyme